MIKVSGQEDRTVFEAFVSRHKNFMVKPINQSGGVGIFRIDAGSMDINECFQKLLASGPCVVEQCIDQAYEMARFHPQSVNITRSGGTENDAYDT